MTRPTARVLALLELLQQGGSRTTADLAARLGVDERTVRRYISHLADLEIPVESVRGRYGGYRLAPGFRLPPLMFTDDEAVAVMLGLVSGRLAGTQASADSAVAKLRRVLPKALAARLDGLLQVTDFTGPVREDPAPQAQVLLRVAEAARARRPVAIEYTDREGRQSERVVRPYGVVARSGAWYLTGADSTSGDVRTFRLDRMRNVVVRDEAFDVPEGFDPAAEVVAGIARTPWRHEVSVRVRGDAEAVRGLLPSGVASVEPTDEPEWVRVRLRAERLDWVPGVLLRLNAPFEVESPDALRDEIKALAERLSQSVDRAGPVPPR